MAVANQIANKPMADKSITYQVNGVNVTLSPSVVRNYLTNGNGNVTDQEVAYFLNLCKYQKLNPLVKECFLIKYGNSPATMVTSKEALLKRAMRNPRYVGHEAGVIVQVKETGEIEYRNGSFVLDDEVLIGGWAKTYVDGYKVPIEAAVSFKEYAATKNDGSINSMWAGKPGTMIRKVALAASLREAFPEDLNGMYASEEVGAEINEAAMAPIEIPAQDDNNEPERVPMYDDVPPYQAPISELADF